MVCTTNYIIINLIFPHGPRPPDALCSVGKVQLGVETRHWENIIAKNYYTYEYHTNHHHRMNLSTRSNLQNLCLAYGSHCHTAKQIQILCSTSDILVPTGTIMWTAFCFVLLVAAT